MEPAAPHPPTAMETETKVSIKTMKEIIRSAGLATADLLEKRDIEARYKQAQARLEEAERLEREKNQPKKKRRIIEESSDDDDDGPMIPEPTGVKKSAVNKFSQYKHVEDEEPGGWTNTKKTAAEVRRDARKGAAHLAREKASKSKKPPPKKRRGAFAEEEDEESEEEASYNGNTSDDEEEDEIGSLPSDSGSDVEVVADDRKSKLDALAARKRAGKPRERTPRVVVQPPRVSPEIIDVDREPIIDVEREQHIDLAGDLSDGHQTSDDEEEDDDAAHKRAERLLSECGAYAAKLITELRLSLIHI